MAPKVAYSELFEPWGWAVSTGNYVDEMEAEMHGVDQNITFRFYRACAIMAGWCIVLLLVTIAVSLTVGEKLVAPLRKMQQFADQLSKGDLTEDIVVSQKNEIGATADNLNVARRQVNLLVKDITKASQDIGDAIVQFEEAFASMEKSISEVDVAVEGIAQNITNQAESTMDAANEVNAIAEGIDSTSKEVAALSKNSDDMRVLSQECSNKISELVQVNMNTKEDVLDMHKQTEVTNEAAENIRRAAGLIDEIAEQTNLLALNASIEAARAGESGKGFAVVASEIGQLASQSAETVEKISKIIDDLVGNTERSLVIMDRVNGTVDHQVGALHETQDIFNHLYDNLNKCIESIATIGRMTEEIERQRQGITSVLGTLNSLAQDNAASSEETSAMTTDLAHIVGRSKQTVAEMKKDIDELQADVDQFSV